MKLKKTKFKDLIIYNGKDFKDKRGFFRELCKKKIIKKIKNVLLSEIMK